MRTAYSPSCRVSSMFRRDSSLSLRESACFFFDQHETTYSSKMQSNQAADKVKVNFHRSTPLQTPLRPRILGVLSTETKTVTYLSLCACAEHIPVEFRGHKVFGKQQSMEHFGWPREHTYAVRIYVVLYSLLVNCQRQCADLPDCSTNLITFPIRNLVIFAGG